MLSGVDGILHHGEIFIGQAKAAFIYTWLMEELVCGGSQMLPIPPATSMKTFHFAAVLWCVGDAYRMIASWFWLLFKAIVMGQDIKGTSWKRLLCLTLTTMLQPRDQCVWTTMLDTHTHTHTHTHRHTHTIERVQWWISYSETQSLPFIGRHEAPTSIHLRTIEAFLVDECVRDILQSNI